MQLGILNIFLRIQDQARVLFSLFGGSILFASEVACSHSQLKGHSWSSDQYHFVSVPLDSAYWRIQYESDGYVLFNPDGSGDMIFAPQAVSDPSQTLSALVTLIETEENPLKNYIVKLEVTTIQQLRQGSPPNDWEVFWFFGNLKVLPNDTKKTNYFLMKPSSGIELGTAFGETGQKFLHTHLEPLLSLGVREKWMIIKKDHHFKVFRNEELILDYKDQHGAHSLYQHPGTFGLYTEDALVRVHSFSYSRL